MMNEQQQIENLKNLHEYLTEAFTGNLSLQPVLKSDCIEIVDNRGYQQFGVYPETLTRETKTIVGTKTHSIEGWIVYAYEFIAATRNEPEDLAEHEIAQCQQPYNVAYEILKAQAEIDITNQLTTLSYKLAERNGTDPEDDIPF
jgi:hypothetical protein